MPKLHLAVKNSCSLVLVLHSLSFLNNKNTSQRSLDHLLSCCSLFSSCEEKWLIEITTRSHWLNLYGTCNMLHMIMLKISLDCCPFLLYGQDIRMTWQHISDSLCRTNIKWYVIRNILHSWPGGLGMKLAFFTSLLEKNILTSFSFLNNVHRNSQPFNLRT